ncbi:MAG TPA: hypothetical protein VG452_02465 [Egibacteraceae bacterium]|nr:hypothetical protein [Egibacteraceae bacterium]
MITAIRIWSDAVTRLVPDLSSLPPSDQYLDPRKAVDSAFAFAEQLLSTQRQFLHDVLSTLVPDVEAVAGLIPEAINARLGAVTREDRLRPWRRSGSCKAGSFPLTNSTGSRSFSGARHSAAC